MTLDDLFPLKANPPAPTPAQLERMRREAERRLAEEQDEIIDDKDQRRFGEEAQ